METALGETSYLMKKSASGSIIFEAKGLRVLNVMVLEILPFGDTLNRKPPQKQALYLVQYPDLDLLFYIISVFTCFFIFILKLYGYPLTQYLSLLIFLFLLPHTFIQVLNFAGVLKLRGHYISVSKCSPDCKSSVTVNYSTSMP